MIVSLYNDNSIINNNHYPCQNEEGDLGLKAQFRHLSFIFVLIPLDFPYRNSQTAPDLGALQVSFIDEPIDGPHRNGEVFGHFVYPKVLFEVQKESVPR